MRKDDGNGIATAFGIPGDELVIGGFTVPLEGDTIFYAEGTVLAHEVGHCLGLFHTHHLTCTSFSDPCDGPRIEIPANPNGDYVDDTNPDPRGEVNENCNFIDSTGCINDTIFNPLTDNIMSYYDGKCRNSFTLGQSVRMDTMVYSSILHDSISNCCTEGEDITIYSGTTIYDYDINDFPGNIYINSGAELIISSKVGFIENKGIIVKEGGRLKVYGGTLTKCLNSNNWRGIEVLGNSNQSQFPNSNQGYVELINANIEFAEVGVSLIKRQTYDNGGGILKATNSKFKNCQQAVLAAKYENFLPVNPEVFMSNLSFFKGCEFTINSDFPFNSTGSLLTLDRVSGISIIDCFFKDFRSNVNQEDLLSSGITGFDARYRVVNSTFEKLRYGINAQNISSIKTFNVRQSNFENNFIGVNVRGVNNFTVADSCNFSIGEFDGTVSSLDHPNRHTGIFIDRCTGFTVEDNVFSLSSGASSGIESIGICSRNTNLTSGQGGTGSPILDANQISKNDFSDLLVGNLANGTNKGELLVGGLVYECNNNIIGNGTDFMVFEGEIATNQISPNNLAVANIFSQDGGDASLSDFNSAFGNNLNYFYYDNGVKEEPIFISPNITKFIRSQNQCVNELEDDEIPQDEFPDVEIKFNAKKQEYLGYKEQYTLLIDNGNTNALISDINNVTILTKDNLKSQLLQYSPYLSQRVIKNVLNNNIFTSSGIQAILEANPEIIRENDIRSEIDNSGKFNQVQLQSIDQASQQSTNRANLELNMSSALGGMHFYANRLQRHYQNDSTNIQLDSIHFWIGERLSLDALYAQVDSWLEQKNVAQAQNLLASIYQQFYLTSEQTTEYNNIIPRVDWTAKPSSLIEFKLLV